MRLLTAAFAAGAIATSAAAATADCRPITNDAERLACYDRAADAAASAGGPGAIGPGQPATEMPAPASAAAAASAPAAAAGSRRYGGSLAEVWEIGAANQRGTWQIQPYKPTYLLPVVVSSGINTQPKTSRQETSLPLPLDFDNSELKFQISLKTKVVQGVFGEHGDLWMGYTQSSRWQLYNDNSRPFRETNYEPEAMLIFPTGIDVLGWRSELLGVSLAHQSNGRAKPLSRSWNRVIGMAGFDRGDWSVMLRPWWRIHESESEDDNPGIENYMGRGDLLVARRWNEHVFSLLLRHSLRSGADAHGSAELEWAFPMAGNLRGRVQLFSGYGESLIDYNFRQTRLGVGVSMVEWR